MDPLEFRFVTELIARAIANPDDVVARFDLEMYLQIGLPDEFGSDNLDGGDMVDKANAA